jgi:hypothetical protein
VARFRNGIAVVALAGGLVAAGGLPALAAPAAPPGVTITATSSLKPVTGDVFVVFTAGKFSTAQIHGLFSGARGEVIRLLAQPFPFKTAPVSAGSVTLNRATGSYSFTVTPTLATRYRVALYQNSTSTTALAASTLKTVYVSNLMTASRLRSCSRPVCHQSVRVEEVVPASTLRDEISKHWYFYFGLNLSATGTPRPPGFATLDTHATISAPVAGGARRFTRTIIWSFRIGRDGYSFIWTACSKDTEATDGLGLPGHHGCGNPRVSARAAYLG